MTLTPALVVTSARPCANNLSSDSLGVWSPGRDRLFDQMKEFWNADFKPHIIKDLIRVISTPVKDGDKTWWRKAEQEKEVVK